MPLNDSCVAATAMALGVPIVAQDEDFPPLAELDIINVQVTAGRRLAGHLPIALVQASSRFSQLPGRQPATLEDAVA